MGVESFDVVRSQALSDRGKPDPAPPPRGHGPTPSSSSSPRRRCRPIALPMAVLALAVVGCWSAWQGLGVPGGAGAGADKLMARVQQQDDLSSPGDGRWITCAGGHREKTEGWYVPPSGPLFAFSAAEAVRCLRRKKLFFAGDSYHMQTFIGLVETLSPKDRGTEEIQGSAARRSELARMQRAVAKHLAPINLKFGCSSKQLCYGARRRRPR